ncbi:MOSC domain-containing protein [Halomonas sp. WWR20]
MPSLSAIHLYPIKSTAGLAVDAGQVREEGLVGDRRYMLAKPDGTFVTARTHPQLQRVRASLMADGLRLRHDTLPDMAVIPAEFSAEPFTTEVWADRFAALTTTAELDAWFSDAAGEPVRLLWLGERSARYREAIDKRVSFADGYPLMLISEASLEDLNSRTADTHVMTQFRPNLVASGTQAFEEDQWQRIRIGEVVFRVAAPCSRCAMVTVDPATGRFKTSREPLKTLAKYRRGEKGKVYFGQNLIAENEGRLALNDCIEILE